MVENEGIVNAARIVEQNSESEKIEKDLKVRIEPRRKDPRETNKQKSERNIVKEQKKSCGVKARGVDVEFEDFIGRENREQLEKRFGTFSRKAG